MISDLDVKGETQAKAFGQSMMPIIISGSLLIFKKQESYAIGDIVFCKVKGRIIDAHKITKMDSQGQYMIANNKGFENGWTKTIYGKVIKAEFGQTIKIF
jgi:SOS-response transcriptional repressor LexA